MPLEGWIRPHPEYEGMVGGRSKLVNEYGVEKPTEWSNLPYGPYRQKKFEWDDKIWG